MLAGEDSIAEAAFVAGAFFAAEMADNQALSDLVKGHLQIADALRAISGDIRAAVKEGG